MKNGYLIIRIICVIIGVFCLNTFIIADSIHKDYAILREDSLNRLARNFAYTDAEKSLELATIALNKATENMNFKEIANAKNNMGIVYFNWGVYEYAITYFTEALQSFRQINNFEGMSRAMNNLGVCANIMNRSDLSLFLFFSSLKIQIYYRNYENIADLLSNISTIYTSLNKDVLSYKFNKRSYDLSDKIGYHKGKAISLNNFGVYYERKNMLDSALYYYSEAYFIAKAQKDENYQIYIYIQNQGSVLEKLGRYEEALEKLDYGIEKVIAFNASAAEHSYYFLYASIYYKLKNYKKAYEYFQKFYEKKEAIISEQVRQKFNQMLVNFQKEQFEKELNLLNEKIQLRKKLQIALFATVLVLILIVILLIIYVKVKTTLNRRTDELRKIEKEFLENQLELQEERAKQEKMLLQQAISQKERELVSASLNLITKNEAIEGVQVFLNHLVQAGQVNRRSAVYKQINELITNAHRTDVMWNDFFLHFENVYPDFFGKLQNKFPQLNNNDLKMCAYLKINLGNKDLARIYNISEHSVKIKKYRLRKKLNIGKEDDLANVFQV
jgi:tetratricopeptide (TPR) repeat protein